MADFDFEKIFLWRAQFLADKVSDMITEVYQMGPEGLIFGARISQNWSRPDIVYTTREKNFYIKNDNFC